MTNLVFLEDCLLLRLRYCLHVVTHRTMAQSCVFQWNLYVDLCFSQHRCSRDRQPPSAHVLLLLLLFCQWCLINVHRAHGPEQWPYHDLWNRRQYGQPYLSECTGLLQITHTHTILKHTFTHKNTFSLTTSCDEKGFRSTELLMLVCRTELLMYSLFLFPLPHTAVNDCGLKLYHYYCIFAAKNQSMFWCEFVIYVLKRGIWLCCF